MLILVSGVGRGARDVGRDERRDAGCRVGRAQVLGRSVSVCISGDGVDNVGAGRGDGNDGAARTESRGGHWRAC